MSRELSRWCRQCNQRRTVRGGSVQRSEGISVFFCQDCVRANLTARFPQATQEEIERLASSHRLPIVKSPAFAGRAQPDFQKS